MRSQLMLRPFWIIFLAACYSTGSSTGKDLGPSHTAEMKAAEALAAEMAGDSDARKALLAEALQAAPDSDWIRWQSGFLRGDDDQWYSAEQVAESANKSGARKTYYKKRKFLTGTIPGEMELATWCEDHGLDSEAQVHWGRVLLVNPSHSEARRHLLDLARKQTVSDKTSIVQTPTQNPSPDAFKYWKPIAQQYLRDLQSKDPSVRDAAIKELDAIHDPAAINALVTAFCVAGDRRKGNVFAEYRGTDREKENAHDAAKILVGVLDNIPEHPATLALVDQAVFSPWDDVRFIAIQKLKKRPLTDFVPILVGNMQIVEIDNYDTIGYSSSRTTGTRLYVETADSKYFIEYHRLHHFGPGILSRREQSQLVSSNLTLGRTDAAFRSFQFNMIQLNQRIEAVLKGVCGDQYSGNPQTCWAAWRDYNELSSPTEKTSYRQAYLHTIVDPYDALQQPFKTYPLPPVRSPPTSCFPAGTPVWTLTGPRPIEEIQPGDRVLAQNPDTGKLDYRWVLGTTTREPSPTVQIRLPHETVIATRGHRFWETGHGWQMAKFLEPGRQIRGVDGSVAIESVEAGKDQEAFNLIVAEDHTFFVGEGRYLVHDNSCPRPTLALIPGWRPY